jgi:sugar lactone lactonase YvrE
MKKLLTLLAGSSLAFYMQACSDNSTSADDDPLKPGSVYVFGSDYKTGELRWVLEDGVSDKKLSFNQDSKLVGIDGNLFVLERLAADNLALVDVSENKVKWQIDLDDASNPSDVVKANKDEVWVALEGAAKFVKIAVKDGKVTKTVETKKFNQGKATTPNLVDLEVSGDTLFALFQRSENYAYPAPGLLAMYKLDNGDLLDTIKLAKKNPTAMGFAQGKLYVASQGEYNENYGTDADEARGIEEIDLSKKTSSLVVSGKKIGGGVYAFAVDSEENVAYAAAYKGYGDVPLMKIDLSKKEAKAVSDVSDVEGSLFFDDVDGVLYIGDRGAKGGLYKYDSGKVTKVESPKEMLPVYSIAIVR